MLVSYKGTVTHHIGISCCLKDYSIIRYDHYSLYKFILIIIKLFPYRFIAVLQELYRDPAPVFSNLYLIVVCGDTTIFFIKSKICFIIASNGFILINTLLNGLHDFVFRFDYDLCYAQSFINACSRRVYDKFFRGYGF